MEGRCIFKKISINIAHLPTVMLIVGYPVYWAELHLFKSSFGKTTLLAPVLFVLISLYAVCPKMKGIRATFSDFKKKLKALDFFSKCLFAIGGGVAFFILLCAFKASLLPPHLIQESDALNYHITLPRQHLIIGSFRHIPWATADLYFLPLDFALAPFWLCTALPNKFPQFIFLIGLVLVAIQLAGQLSKNNYMAKILAIFAVLGFHIVGIQMGTAMLDIVMCYLFLASLDSFMKGDIWLCAVEFAFYFWAKSFIPVQIVLSALSLCVLYVILRKLGFRVMGWNTDRLFDRGEGFRNKIAFKRILVRFFFVSLVVGGPFIAKSYCTAGTPLYPFFVGTFPSPRGIERESPAWQSLLNKTEKVMATKDQYGSGRSPLEFIRHLWLISVPEKGVNNRYDYPVGLLYLLCVGPFCYTLIQSLRHKEFLILPLFVAVLWGVWWQGSHQTRFLLTPLILMNIIVMAQGRFQTRAFVCGVLLSLVLVSVSMFRAHRRDLGLSAWEVLRPKDKQLLIMSKTVNRNQPVKLKSPDAAFADFPVEVVNGNSVFVLEY